MTKHHYSIGRERTKDLIVATVEDGTRDYEETEKVPMDDPAFRRHLGSVSSSVMRKGPILFFLIISTTVFVMNFCCPQNKVAAMTSSKDAVNDPHESRVIESKEKKKTNNINRTIERYSFEAFVAEHNKKYTSQDEHDRRRRIFDDNLSTILRHNAKIGTGDSKAKWKMGINRFTDHLQDELPKGLDKWNLLDRRMNSDHHSVPSAASPKPNPTTYDSSARAALLSSLPESVDWRGKGVTTPVKNQGHCGSCWAFASTAALESHVALRTGKLFEFSVQELVTCAPNPNHCGGTGGCGGSTAELAYEFLSSGRGVVTEWEWSYTSGRKNHSDPTCELPTDWNSTIPDAVAAIDGYVNLEMNNYDALLTAVATVGPVTVSVAATGWGLYDGGIFHDGDMFVSPASSRDINHLVVVEGYGTEVVIDEATGEEESHDYWLVRNSWGPLWGEDGYIRLRRDSRAAEIDCRPDATPADGIACVGPDNSTIPPVVQVCGTSGILYNAVYPTGGHLLPKNGGGGAAGDSFEAARIDRHLDTI